MSRNYNSNPITIDEIVKDIARVAEEAGISEQELSLSKYASMGGQYGQTTIARKGGWNKIKNSYFPEQEKDLKTIHKLKKSGTYVSKLENHLGEKLNVEELVKEVISKLNVKVSTQKKSKVKKSKDEDEIEVLASLNDMHYGLKVDPDEIGGLNKYDYVEAGRRTALHVKEIANYKLHKRHKVKKLHLMLNGDLLAGLIHNLTTQSQHLMIHQMNGALHILTHAIEHLAKAYSNIEVHCVAGNHDRMVHKEHGKRAINEVYDSYAHIIFYSLSTIFKKNKGISFNIPKTPYCTFKIPSGRAGCFHGDHIFSSALRGVGKSINVKAITDAIRTFNAGEVSKGNEPLKLFFFAHVHAFGHFITTDGVEVYICPPLCGADPYAHSLGINDNMVAQPMMESTTKYALGDARLNRLVIADKDSSLDAIIPVYNKELKV